MPPEQCPECGRFLKAALVASLADAPAACPKCGTGLTAEMFDLDAADGPPPLPAEAIAPSVRPPDLAPEAVRDDADPLAGWDTDEPAGVVVDDQRPFPIDTVVVGAAAVLGAVAGATFGKRPGRDAALGALGGVIGAAVARRIWHLP